MNICDTFVMKCINFKTVFRANLGDILELETC